MYSIKKVTMLLGCLALTCSIAFQASATEKFKVITTFTISQIWPKTWLEMLQKSHP